MSRYRKFISDMGRALVVEASDGEVFQIDRYAVWGPWEGTGKAVVIETGPNLAKLRRKHKIKGPVVKFKPPE